MIKKLNNAIFSSDDIDLVIEDSGNVSFCSDEMGVLSVDLNNINLDDDNFIEDDPETIIHVKFMAWRNEYKQHNACEKDMSKELMPAVWPSTRWWDCACQKMRKKKNKTSFG